MPPAYKLSYFPVTALGEPIRFLLKYGEIEFEDFRFKKEDWPQIKPNFPFGQAPVLEYNGKVANQSVAISRYVAKQVKLVGDNDWEDLEIDAIVDTIHDLRQKIAVYHYEADEAVKEKKKEPLFKETIPYYMERFETITKTNNGHFAVGRLTWADFVFAALLEYLTFMTKFDITENYPNVQAAVKNVTDLPAIKKWIEERPQSLL